MKILIATGIFPPDIGGPATYAKNIADEFSNLGHKVRVLSYGLEKKLPIGVRHCLYFFRVVFHIYKTDLIIALDTFSVGWPVVLASKIFNKKVIIRVGGDFLWENYIETTGNLITLKDFNSNIPALSLKQKIIFKLTKFVLKNSKVVFSTKWQRDIFIKTYGLKQNNIYIIENFYGTKLESNNFRNRSFLWAGRDIKLKNIKLLKQVFSETDQELEISENILHDELMERIKNCYAIILPSLSEVSPNFILEAMQFNRPFICTKETGLYDKLKDIGLFINPLDKEDIKNKVLFLAKDENYQEYKKRVENFSFTHSWKEITSEFLEII